MRLPYLVTCAITAAFICLPGSAAETPEAKANVVDSVAAEQQLLAKQLANILRASRKVLSDNQGLINDPEKGDKGLSADVVLMKAAENYLAATKEALPSTEGDSRQARSCAAMLAAVRTIMDKAQPLINESGKGFKGFLPAVFAAQVAMEFSNKMEGTAFIKLTAPQELIRNRRNRPDDWESRVIESRFKAADWEKGKFVVERGEHKGKSGERLLLPEYYVESCMQCHGGPKGERDISGGLKEGASLGDLGGAISVVVYDEK